MDELYGKSIQIVMRLIEIVNFNNITILHNILADPDIITDYLITDPYYKHFLIHKIIYDRKLSDYDICKVLFKFNFQLNELQTQILIQKSLANVNSHELFLIKNLPILNDLKVNVINFYLYISCPLLNLI